MRETKKKLKKACRAACLFMALFLLPPLRAGAAEATETGMGTGTEAQAVIQGQGTVRIRFLVDFVYQYKDSIQICFQEAETGELFLVSHGDFREDACESPMPEGRWRFRYVNFEDEPVYGAKGSLLDGDEFTIREGETTEVSILVQEHFTSTQLMYVELEAGNTPGFDGTVQIWMEGEADAYYTDAGNAFGGGEDTSTRIRERYVLRFDSNLGYVTKVDAGDYRVTDIRAYDGDGKPMDIAYDEEIRVGRYNDKPVIEVSIFPAGEGTAEGGKILKRASDTPEFELNYYIRDVEDYRTYLGYEKEPLVIERSPEELKQDEADDLAYREYVERKEAEGEQDAEEPVLDTGGDFSPYALLVALLLPLAAVLCLAYRYLKKGRKKKWSDPGY